MLTDSSDEDNGLSTQDQEAIKKLLAMDRETFLANWTGLESTRNTTLTSRSTSSMDITDDDNDSDNSHELDYLQVLRNPFLEQPPTPISTTDNTTNITDSHTIPVQQQQKTGTNMNENQEQQRTGYSTSRRSLRPRNVNQMQPFTYDKKIYNEMIRRSKYTELLQYDPNENTQMTTARRRYKSSAKDQYEDEGIDTDDDEMNPDDEFTDQIVDPEELLPVKRVKTTLIIPSHRPKTHSKIIKPRDFNKDTNNKKSDGLKKYTTKKKKSVTPRPTTPAATTVRTITTNAVSNNTTSNFSSDVWSVIPRASTVYSITPRKRSKNDKGKGPAQQQQQHNKPLIEMDSSVQASQSSTTSTQNEKNLDHIHSALRDVFTDLFDSGAEDNDGNHDDDMKSTSSNISLDSVLIRASKEQQINPSFEDFEADEELHIPSRRKRFRKSHSLDDDDGDEKEDVFAFPTTARMTDPSSIENNNHDNDNDNVFDFPEPEDDNQSVQLQKQRPLDQLVIARSRRKQQQAKDDDFVVYDGSLYDHDRRRKKNTLRGVLPFSYKPEHEKKQFAVQHLVEDDNYFDSSVEDDNDDLAPSLQDYGKYNSSPVSNSSTDFGKNDNFESFSELSLSTPVRRRQRTLTGYVHSSSSKRSNEKTYSTNKKSGRLHQMQKEAVSRARTLQTKTSRSQQRTTNNNNVSPPTQNKKMNYNTNTSSSWATNSSPNQKRPPPAIQPRRSKKKNPNGELYILPGPNKVNSGWQSSIRPHLSVNWTETGELCIYDNEDESAHLLTSPADRISPNNSLLNQDILDYHSSTRGSSAGYISTSPPPYSNQNNISNATRLQVMEEDSDIGPMDPFGRLLYKHPHFRIDWGMPDGIEVQLQGTYYLQHNYLHRLLITSPQQQADTLHGAGLFDNAIELFNRQILLTQQRDLDENMKLFKDLFREAFKYIGALFDNNNFNNQYQLQDDWRDTTFTRLLLFFQFITEVLSNWVIRLPSGQQRPMIEFLNAQCKLLYSRAWCLAGLDDDHYWRKSRPLFSSSGGGNNMILLTYNWKALLALLIYALDWTSQVRAYTLSTSEEGCYQEDCKQRLLWLLYWIGPTLTHLRQDGGQETLYAKEPLVVEGWICLFHLYELEDVHRYECWTKVMELLDQHVKQDKLTIKQEMERKWHWLLVLNVLRYVDKKGIYTKPREGIITTVETMCGRELANGLIAAITENS
ncbi:hypothetical protein BDC45DRAFT_609259 [Circinella umbellata]|nr:hypothetical protein BDC45DRAFT_609259 [Circinella umbellata]